MEEVEQTLKKPNKFSFLNLPETIGILSFGIFVILLKLILQKQTAQILIKIIYATIGLLFVMFAILSLYMIITEGNSIISDVKNTK